LRTKYEGLLSNFLSEVYPDIDWLPWKFEKCPHNYWNSLKNQRQFMDWAGKELKVKEMSDWYKVTYKVTGYIYFQVEILGSG
jgi:hypothetical protein